MSHSKVSPTAEQFCALHAFRKAHGRNYKSVLRQAWETGNYPADADIGALQTLRNTHGPRWLHNIRLDASDYQ